MVEFGWIFPDGTEYNTGFDIHETAVEEFIRGLRFFDLKLKRQFDDELEDLFFDEGGSYYRSNFAIRRLGWIKVGQIPFHVIKYAGYDWQSDLVAPYEEQGYQIDNLYERRCDYIPIKCNILLAIRNGSERYDDSDRPFKYDGTDKGDFFIDEAGVRHLAPWSTSNT